MVFYTFDLPITQNKISIVTRMLFSVCISTLYWNLVFEIRRQIEWAVMVYQKCFIQVRSQKQVFLVGWQNPRKMSSEELVFYYFLKLNFSAGNCHRIYPRLQK